MFIHAVAYISSPILFLPPSLPSFLLFHSIFFPHSSVGKESACNAGYRGSVPGWGRSPGEGNDYQLQYSCLENPMDRGVWQATIHGVARVGHDLVTRERERESAFHCM